MLFYLGECKNLMKKLLSVFLSFLLLAPLSSLVVSEKHIVMAAETQQENSEKVDRQFFPLLWNLALISLKNGFSVAKSTIGYSYDVVLRIPSSIGYLFTGNKDATIEEQKIEIKKFKGNLKKCLNNENCRKVWGEVVREFE